MPAPGTPARAVISGGGYSPLYNPAMRLIRALVSLLRGTCDQDAFRDYRARLLKWASRERGLSRAEYADRFENRYVDPSGRDLFLDYLRSASQDAPSYVTDHEGLLHDRAALYERFGLPILTMRELRDKENERLRRIESPFRV